MDLYEHVWNSIVWYGMVPWYSMVLWYSMVWYRVVRLGVVHCTIRTVYGDIC